MNRALFISRLQPDNADLKQSFKSICEELKVHGVTQEQENETIMLYEEFMQMQSMNN